MARSTAWITNHAVPAGAHACERCQRAWDASGAIGTPKYVCRGNAGFSPSWHIERERTLLVGETTGPRVTYCGRPIDA